MEKIGFSVIIPCYNAGNFLIETIESILIQPFYYPFEVIVVDDGSTDPKTKLILNKIISQEKIRVVKLPINKGLSYARNRALKISTFKYVFTVDADDCLNAEASVVNKGTYADRAISILESSPEIAFVHAMTLMFGDFNGLTISAYPVDESMILKKHHAPNSIVYRKEDALGAGLRDNDIKKWTDWSFAVSLLNYRFLSGKQNQVKFLPLPYYLYRVHSHPQRLSLKKVSELSMIRKTFLLYPEIFKKYYRDIPHKEIPKAILVNKPDKLNDLLHVAANDLNIAFEIVKSRNFKLTFNQEQRNIP